MKFKTESSDSKKSLSKSKITKDQLINSILSQAKSQIKIKEEPISEEESVEKSNTNTPFKDKAKSKTHNNLDREDLISKLVLQQSQDLSKRKRRKSHNESLDLSAISSKKKVKIEKSSEDERRESPFNKKINRSNRDSFSPIKVKKEEEDTHRPDISVSKERQNFEQLFSKSEKYSNIVSKHNSERKSVLKSKQADVTKVLNQFGLSDKEALAKSKSTKLEHSDKNLALNGDSNSSSEDEISIPKPKVKTEGQSFNALHFEMDDNSDGEPSTSKQHTAKPEVKSKKILHPIITKTEPRESDSSSSESEAEISHPKPKGILKSSINSNVQLITRSDDSKSTPKPQINKLEPSKPASAGKKLVSTTSSSSSEELSESDIDELLEKTSSEITAGKNVSLIAPKYQVRAKKNANSSSSSSETSEDGKTISTKVTRQNSDEESSSEDEVALPKHVKTETAKRNKMRLKQAPTPLKSGKIKSDSDSSSDEEVATNQVVKKTATAISQKSETESSSEEEISIPKTQQIQNESPKKKQSPFSDANKSVTQSSESDSSSQEGTQTASRVSKKVTKQDSDEESSSEDEVALPKPIKTETVKINKVGLKQPPTPLKSSKIKSDSDSSSNEEVATNQVVKKTATAISQKSETESSSEEEISIPKPQQIKKESPKKKQSPLSDANKSVEQSSESDSSSQEETQTTSRVSKKVTRQDSNEESTSEDEVPLPKHVKTETVKTNKVGLKQSPTPLKSGKIKSDSDSSSDEEVATNQVVKKTAMAISPKSETESSSEEEISIPKPQQIKKELPKKKQSPFSDANKSVKQSPESNSSSQEQTQTASRVSKKIRAAVNQDSSAEDSSSDGEAPVSKPEQIKNELPKVNSSKKKQVSVPLPVKLNKSDSSSEGEVSATKQIPKKTITAKTDSSSDEEVPPPKPKVVKKEAPVKHSSDSDSNSENETNPVSKKTATTSSEDSEPDSSTSDEEVPLPNPKQVKNELPELTVLQKKRVSVPAPIKSNKYRFDSSERSSGDYTPTAKKVSEKVLNQNFGSGSSSDEEVPVPKSTQIKNESPGLKMKQVSVPTPIKQSSDSGSSSEETPKATQMFKKQNKATDSDSNSSSDEEVPVPKPKQIKSEPSKAPKVFLTEKKKVSVPSSIKTSRKAPESTSEDNESEDEMPLPKKMKIESSSITAGSSQKKHIPMPIRPSDSDDSMSSSDRNIQQSSSSNRELEKLISVLTERTPYKEMNWIDKIKHRFPQIEKRRINTELPRSNTKYSLLLVPKNIEARSLVKLKCHLNKETVVIINNKEYIFEPLPKRPDPVFVSLNGPRLINLQSVISLQQFLPKLTLKKLDVPKREDISLPSEIKVRHPLFGVNYKKQLSLDKNVKKKLQEAMEYKRKVEEKHSKRQKRKRKNSLRNVEENVLNIFNSIGTHNSLDIKGIDLIPVKTEDSLSELNSPTFKRNNSIHLDTSKSDYSVGENNSFGSAKKKHKSKKKDIKGTGNSLEMSQNNPSEKGYKKKKQDISIEEKPSKKKKNK